MKGFWLAWQFLTRLPAPVYAQVDAREIGRAQAWYPWVGLSIGGLLYAALWALQLTSLSDGVIAALLLILWVAITGALHLDGLADVADAWIGSQGDRERALAIMKDSRSGPMGVTVLVLLLLLKFSLLQQLFEQSAMALFGLILVPALARLIVPLLFASLSYLRPEGLGRALADHLPLKSVFASGLALAAIGDLLVGMSSLWLWLALLWIWLLLRALFKHRFGGLTGDMAGAAIELCEALLLLTALSVPTA